MGGNCRCVLGSKGGINIQIGAGGSASSKVEEAEGDQSPTVHFGFHHSWRSCRHVLFAMIAHRSSC